MKIHSVELRQVRQIKELVLDLSSPLTIIGGPNGVGKTTLQQAILAAMFHADKKLRDSFVSEFDPDSPPTAELGLSHGDETAAIVLSRTLTDDNGEWREGGTVLKRKGLALDKIQEVLPITADAAALLLWGRQDDMPRVVEDFPPDGHTLLTAASIKGSGPDPKDIVAELDKDIENSRKGEKGGQVVGALTQAKKGFDLLEAELQRATIAEAELLKRKNALQEATQTRDQVSSKVRESEMQVKQLENLERLLAAALRDDAKLGQHLKQQQEWAALEEEIDRARKATSGLETEVLQLLAQYRVARDADLQREIAKLMDLIKAGDDLDAALADLERYVTSTRRPEPSDIQDLEKLQHRLRQTQAKIEATGVRYELATIDQPRKLHVAEDGKPARDLTLAAGDVHGGIVGRLAVEIDGLRLTAAGKEDIAALKDAVDKTNVEIRNLFAPFMVEDETAFRNLAKEKEQLQNAMKDNRQELRLKLGGSALADIRLQLERLQAARKEINVSIQDQEACGGKNLPRAADLMNQWSGKKASFEAATEKLAGLEKKRPSESDMTVNKQDLEVVRASAAASVAAFTASDSLGRAPTQGLAEECRVQLAKARSEKDRSDKARLTAEKSVSDLAGQLKQTQPHRPLAEIQSDLEDAKDSLNREQVLQDARSLLKERIEEKMEALGSQVPVELGKRITQQLARLAGGPFHEVFLEQGLTVSHVAESGARKNWQPHQLSHGERHQAALAVKLAVARALAETTGPVFVMLDDSLVTFDPHRRAATEELLLDQVVDEKLQIILLTCHTDWAADWKTRCPEQVEYIDLAKCAQYYREPPAVVGAGASRVRSQ